MNEGKLGSRSIPIASAIHDRDFNSHFAILLRLRRAEGITGPSTVR